MLRMFLLTLQLGLRWAADAVSPQDGRVIDKGKPELGLQVKVLPASSAHRRVEHVGHVQRHAQSHVRLHQVQHLQQAKIINCVYFATWFMISYLCILFILLPCVHPHVKPIFCHQMACQYIFKILFWHRSYVLLSAAINFNY